MTNIRYAWKLTGEKVRCIIKVGTVEAVKGFTLRVGQLLDESTLSYDDCQASTCLWLARLARGLQKRWDTIPNLVGCVVPLVRTLLA